MLTQITFTATDSTSITQTSHYNILFQNVSMTVGIYKYEVKYGHGNPMLYMSTVMKGKEAF